MEQEIKKLTLLEQQVLYDNLEKAAAFFDVVQLQSQSVGTSIRRQDNVDSIREAIALISKPLQLKYNVGDI